MTLQRLRSVPPAEWAVLAALVVLAVAARFVGRNYVTADMQVFFDWYAHLQEHGWDSAVGNYNAPFLYLLMLAGWLPGELLFNLKAIFVVFDVVLAWFVYRIVALKYTGWRIPAAAALITVFLPTVVVNASMYGQCDSIWASFCVGALYFFLRDRPWLAVSFCALAYAFKPLGIFIFPVLALLLLGGLVRWRTLLIAPVVYVAVDVPIMLIGRDPIEVLTLYFHQLDDPKRLVRGGPTIYQFFDVRVGAVEMAAIGTLLAAAAVLGICWVLTATRTELDRTRIVTAAACFGILVPFLQPRMHERYFYLADVLTLILAFYVPRRWYLPLLVQVASFLSYLPFMLRGGPPGTYVDRKVLSALMLVALVIAGYELLRDVRGSRLTDDPVTDDEPGTESGAPEPRRGDEEPEPGRATPSALLAT
ncbi:glycosyltransferase 87 family protein [Cryptosporangium aurantiacum]|uniref:Mannosyltransferase related to Gpi18 n=1 Tax=Cryptosporangium aurantiacum TaxID=134849 RepID=A0A1M7RPP9_9ACTN|nr:glycosyltransferase 87 family protein [Cryptosporangium aurantiacum]SHN48062.1 Mannosyltransferase related to Gpi18 [Cryptosporangium aurantiacum]